jgi:phage tail P2-like protein
MLDLGQVSFADLVPESIRDDPTVTAAMQALDGEFAEITALAVVPSIFARIDEAPADVLDHLAWQLNSTTWRDSWSLDLKRSAVKTLVTEQAKKGTRYALEKAVRSYGSNIAIREWWETTPEGPPHTVAMVLDINTLDGQLVSTEIQEDLLRRIDDVKPVRTQYDWSLSLKAETGVGIQAAARPASYLRIRSSDLTGGALRTGVASESNFVIF